MAIKIHMLNVGDADAIIVQLENSFEKISLLVDGGKNSEHAGKIISYLENLRIAPDILICTHLDKDHIGGLGDVIEKYHKAIKSIWAHIPTKHDTEFKLKLFSKMVEKNASGRVDKRLELIMASVQEIEDFIQVADRYNIRVLEPFSDTSDEQIISLCKKWKIEILSPSVSFYDSLVPLFRNTYVPSPPKKIYEHELVKAGESPCLLIGREGYDTPENESSLIFKISDNGKNYLFTGDVGLQAFERIDDKLTEAYWVKIPHHGSKKNLNQRIIERVSPRKCFISAVGKNGHPDDNLKKCLEKKNAQVECTGEENSDLIE